MKSKMNILSLLKKSTSKDLKRKQVTRYMRLLRTVEDLGGFN